MTSPHETTTSAGTRAAANRLTVKAGDETEELAPSQAAEHLLNECRMVLPGIQALFGFQLIAVFSDGFANKLTSTEQRIHFFAIALVAAAIAIIMTPATLHRYKGPRVVTQTFIDVSSCLLLWSMAPLAASICLEFYLIGRLIIGHSLTSLFAAVLFALFVGLWFVLPRSTRLQRIISRR
jgi:hypothetical protein